MGPWELGDFAVAKPKMRYNIHGPPIHQGPYDSGMMCVSTALFNYSSIQQLFSITFHRGLKHMFIKILLLRQNQKLGLSQQMRFPGRNQQGEV